MKAASRNAERPAARRSPWQFTVRAFFAATILISAFSAAAKGLEEPLRPLVLALLAWGTLGGLYLRFRAVAPLVALGLGAGVLVGLWGNVAMVCPGILEVPSVLDVPTAALTWGAGLSLLVTALSMGSWVVSRAGRRRSPSRGRDAARLEPGSSLGPCALAVALFVAHTGMLAGAVLMFLTGYEIAKHGAQVGISALDLPLYPFLQIIEEGMPGLSWGFRFRLFPPDESWLAMAAGSAVFGGILYAGVGWLIGYLAGIIHFWRPRRLPGHREDRDRNQRNGHDSLAEVRATPSRP